MQKIKKRSSMEQNVARSLLMPHPAALPMSTAAAPNLAEPNAAADPKLVWLISDSSGETAVHLARAALAQFPQGTFALKRLPPASSVQCIEALIETIPDSPSVIAFTIVVPELRAKFLEKVQERRDVHVVDLLGSLVSHLAELSPTPPLYQARRQHQITPEYFKRMEAVDFSVQYDDGKGLDSLQRADVVITGISRTSKTPTSMYLAYHYGLRAANVPLVYGVEVPKALFSIPKERIFGLIIDPIPLLQLRLNRVREMGLHENTVYTDRDRLFEELRWSRSVFQQLGCRTLGVTHRAVEETASEIARMVADPLHGYAGTEGAQSRTTESRSAGPRSPESRSSESPGSATIPQGSLTNSNF